MRDPFNWMNPGGNNADDQDAREAIEKNEEMAKAYALLMREKARLFLDVFGVGRGPELLELLRSETIEVDLMNLSAVIGTGAREVPVNPSEWAYHRNGQNSVVHYIETMMRHARTSENEEPNDV